MQRTPLKLVVNNPQPQRTFYTDSKQAFSLLLRLSVARWRKHNPNLIQVWSPR